MTTGQLSLRILLVAASAFVCLWLVMWIPAFAGNGGWLFLYPVFMVLLVPILVALVAAIVLAIVSLARRHSRRVATLALVLSTVLLFGAPVLLWFGAFIPLDW